MNLDQTGSGFKDTDPTRTWICNPDSRVKFLILKRYELNAATKGMDGLFKGEGALHIQQLHTAHKVKLRKPQKKLFFLAARPLRP